MISENVITYECQVAIITGNFSSYSLSLTILQYNYIIFLQFSLTSSPQGDSVFRCDKTKLHLQLFKCLNMCFDTEVLLLEC